MSGIKHYQVQILLLTLACFEIFAYFYPGYTKGFLYALVQVCLMIAIIAIILANKFTLKKHHYN